MRLFSVAMVLGLGLACSEYEVKPEDPAATVVDTDEPVDPPPTEPPPTEEPAPATPEPDIEVEPVELPFGFLPAACPSAPELVTVRNVGDADLIVEGFQWVDDVGAFDHTGTSLTLAPGESYQLFVTFEPPVDGQWLDVLRIASNDPDEAEVDVLADGTGADAGQITEQFTQNLASAVDVLFVLDNSGSMSDNLHAIGQAIPSFFDSFVQLGLDYNVGVVTTDMDDPAQSGRLVGPLITPAMADPVAEFVAQSNTGASGSGDERGLEAAYAALDPSQGLINTTNAGLLRPGSNLSIIVVSDEDDSSSDPVWQFNQWLNQLQGDPDLTSLSIVGGPRGGLFPCFSFFGGTSADPVPRYWNAASNTGGIHGDLCSANFNPILTNLATVASGLRRSYPLDNQPDDPSLIEVQVDGQTLAQGQQNGWTYDGANNTIEFHGSGVPGEGTTVTIRFPGETVCP